MLQSFYTVELTSYQYFMFVLKYPPATINNEEASLGIGTFRSKFGLAGSGDKNKAVH
jgi:hypothetical protein